MPELKLKVLAVAGSLQTRSVTRVVVSHTAEILRNSGCEVDLWDLGNESLPLFNPDTVKQLPQCAELRRRVDQADVIILGTPDYHGSLSGVMKNFLDHFWHEFVGKLFATIVASHEKGLTVTEHLRTIARQCYAWSLPYGVAFCEKEDVKDGKVASEALRGRLEMLARDARVYGGVIADQRRRDLGCDDHCFMARHRRK